MDSISGETVDQQAYVTRFLLDHTAAPLAGDTFLRGVLPVRNSVRIVTGAAGAVAAHELVAYELPLSDEAGEPVTAPLVLGWVRTLVDGAFPRTDATVMGIPLALVDTSSLEPADPTRTDQALRVLRTLGRPFVDSPPSPALCGFLFTGRDGLRLYVAVPGDVGPVIAVDVRLTGALTALLAALPSLVEEEERRVPDPSDPHCVRAVDLTDW
ncbi:hypothetical protein OHT52_13620 [Streptomyces sp. NBC_00247]|uniref:hypothetical protein n=1 Tax=Streptomyces sp. NBC_00247 TaxID=2975689 RepID=UPI002E294DEC|nr:hypothetical protein [Streptomyces sp. NBC_00247]